MHLGRLPPSRQGSFPPPGSVAGARGAGHRPISQSLRNVFGNISGSGGADDVVTVQTRRALQIDPLEGGMDAHEWREHQPGQGEPDSWRSRARQLVYGDAGLALARVNAALSLVSCGIYVGETYVETALGDDQGAAEYLALGTAELLLGLLFLGHYLLLAAAVPSLRSHLLGWAGLLDLFTLLPAVLVGSVDYGPQGLSLLRLLRLLRVLRILRVHRLFAYTPSPVLQQAYRIGLTIAGIIFVTSSVFVEVENLSVYHHEDDSEPLAWGDGLYWTVSTISTVGYGDVVPRSPLGKVVVMATICVSFIVVPLESNELVNIMGKGSMYTKASYHRRRHDASMALVVGNVQTAGFEQFLHELLHEDHGMQSIDVVVLAPCEPSVILQHVMKRPEYSPVVQYLNGTPLLSQDLLRARAHTADAIFVLADKAQDAYREEADADTILAMLYIKRFAWVYARANVRGFLQLLLPQSKRHCARLDNVLNADVVCVDELKMNVLAASCRCPGIGTLLYNLVASSVAPRLSGVPEWQREYLGGSSFELYCVTLSEQYTGLSFVHVSAIIYEESGAVLVGLELDGLVVFNPGTLRIPPASKAFVIAQSAEEAAFLAKGAFRQRLEDLEDTQTRRPSRVAVTAVTQAVRRSSTQLGRVSVAAGGRIKSLLKRSTTGSSPMATMGVRLRKRRNSLPSAGTGDDDNDDDDDDGDDDEGTFFGDGNKARSKRSSDDFDIDTRIRELRESSRPRQRDDELLMADRLSLRFHVLDTPAKDDAIQIENVFGLDPWLKPVVVTGSKRDLLHLLKPLRLRSDDVVQPVVLLHPTRPDYDAWQSMRVFPAVYWVQGSPLNTDDLIRAGVKRASGAVVMAGGDGDAAAIFAFQAMRKLNANLRVVTELDNADNTSFLEPSFEEFQRAQGIDSYFLDPLFASGTVFSASLLDRLACQTFYNPSMLAIVEELLLATGASARGSSRLHSVAIPHVFAGATYGQLFRFLGERQHSVCVGLLRAPAPAPSAEAGAPSPEAGAEAEAPASNKHSYVVTSPPPSMELHKGDRVFVLAVELQELETALAGMTAAEVPPSPLADVPNRTGSGKFAPVTEASGSPKKVSPKRSRLVPGGQNQVMPVENLE